MARLNEEASVLLISVFHRGRVRHFLVVEECGRHQVLALTMKLGDPTHVRTKQAQGVELRNYFELIIAAHLVLVGSICNVDFYYSTTIFLTNISACHLNFGRGTDETRERDVILIVVTLAFQVAQSKVNMRNGVVEDTWLRLRVRERNLRDSGVEEAGPDKPPIIIQEALPELAVSLRFTVIVLFALLVRILMHTQLGHRQLFLSGGATSKK